MGVLQGQGGAPVFAEDEILAVQPLNVGAAPVQRGGGAGEERQGKRKPEQDRLELCAERDYEDRREIGMVQGS